MGEFQWDYKTGHRSVSQLGTMSDCGNFYRVTANGNVYSSRASKLGPEGVWKIMKPTLAVNGYLHVMLTTSEGRKRFCAIHVLLAGLFIGPRPEGQYVRHLDGNPLNNRLSNLAYGTPKDNSDDSLRHGTRRFGEERSLSILTEDVVREIRKLYQPKVCTYAQLGERFGVASETIRDVVKGYTWSHVN